jgi:hypothetical protein
MVTASPARLFDHVPLCVEVRELWVSFLIELRSRLERWERLEGKGKDVADHVRDRIREVKREHLGPGIDDGVWKVAKGLDGEVRRLLTDHQIDNELEALEKLRDSNSQGNP